MDLPKFIRGLGVKESAELFDATERQVKGWLYGERRPRPKKAQLIIERTKGKVTLSGIYGAQQ